MVFFGLDRIDAEDIPDILPLKKEKAMNLKDWEKLSPEEQERRYSEKPATAYSDTKAESDLHYGPSKGKCPAGLLELRNLMKKQIDEERDASSQYREASAKLVHYGHGASAYHLKEIAEQELMHHYVLRQIVDVITLDCGE